MAAAVFFCQNCSEFSCFEYYYNCHCYSSRHGSSGCQLLPLLSRDAQILVIVAISVLFILSSLHIHVYCDTGHASLCQLLVLHVYLCWCCFVFAPCSKPSSPPEEAVVYGASDKLQVLEYSGCPEAILLNATKPLHDKRSIPN